MKPSTLHSKCNSNELNTLIHSQKTFDSFFNNFLNSKSYNTSNTSILENIALKKPNFFSSYYDKILNILNSKNKLVLRVTLRTLQYIDTIPDKYTGKLINHLQPLILKKENGTATQIFAMQVFFNLSKKHKPLQLELKHTISQHYNFSSPGFKSRSNKLLKELNKK